MERLRFKSITEMVLELWEKYILDLCARHDARVESFKGREDMSEIMLEYLSYSALLRENLEEMLMKGEPSLSMNCHVRKGVSISGVLDLNLSDDTETFHKIFNVSDLESTSEFYADRFYKAIQEHSLT